MKRRQVCVYLCLVLIVTLSFMAGEDECKEEVEKLADEIKENVLNDVAFTKLVTDEIERIYERERREVDIEALKEDILSRCSAGETGEDFDSCKKNVVEEEIGKILNTFDGEIRKLISNDAKTSVNLAIREEIEKRIPIPEGGKSAKLDPPEDYPCIWQMIVEEKTETMSGSGIDLAYKYTYKETEIDKLCEDIYTIFHDSIMEKFQVERDRCLNNLREYIKSELGNLTPSSTTAPPETTPSSTTASPETTLPPPERTLPVELLIIILLILGIVSIILYGICKRPDKLEKPTEDSRNGIFQTIEHEIPQIESKSVIQRGDAIGKPSASNREPTVPKAQLDKSKKEIDSLKNELEERKRTDQKLISSHREEMSRLEGELKKSKHEMTSLQDQLKELENEMTSLQKGYKEMEKTRNEYENLQKFTRNLESKYHETMINLETITQDYEKIQEQYEKLRDLGYDVLTVKIDDIKKTQNPSEFMAKLQEKGVGAEFENMRIAASLLAEKETALKQLRRDIEKTKPARNPVFQEYWFHCLIFLNNLPPAEYGAGRGDKPGEASLTLVWDKAILSVIQALNRMFSDSDTVSSMRAVSSLEVALPEDSDYQEMWRKASAMSWDEAKPLVRQILEIGDSGDYRLLGFFKIFANQIEELIDKPPSEPAEKEVLFNFLKACGIAFNSMLKAYPDIIRAMRDASSTRS